MDERIKPYKPYRVCLKRLETTKNFSGNLLLMLLLVSHTGLQSVNFSCMLFVNFVCAMKVPSALSYPTHNVNLDYLRWWIRSDFLLSWTMNLVISQPKSKPVQTKRLRISQLIILNEAGIIWVCSVESVVPAARYFVASILSWHLLFSLPRCPPPIVKARLHILLKAPYSDLWLNGVMI